MSQPTGKQKTIIDKLRAIHFHRILLDESHYNNTGERVKLSLSQLSSTMSLDAISAADSVSSLWRVTKDIHGAKRAISLAHCGQSVIGATTRVAFERKV